MEGQRQVNEENLSPFSTLESNAILVADDNEVNLTLTKEILEAGGYAVDPVENGLLAVEAFAGKSYLCILMDAEMPVMDGIEAIIEIRRMEEELIEAGGRRTPVICVTAHPEVEFCDKARKSGMDECVRKPVDFDRLLRLISDLAAAGHVKDGSRGGRAEQAGETAGESVFDLSKALAQFGGDRDLLAGLVDTFLKNAASQISSIEKAHKSGDLDCIVREAHSIRGACVTLAAGLAAKAAADLEDAAKKERYTLLPELIATLKDGLAAFGGHMAAVPIKRENV